MTASVVLEAAEALITARRTRRFLEALPSSARPRDQAEAYAIQNEVARRTGPVKGWKVGAPSPAGDPSCAPICADTLFFGSDRLPAELFHVMRIEAEIMYRLKDDLPSRDDPWTRDEVLEAIGSVHPGFEVCDTRFSAHRSQDPLSHLADQANHGALVVGPAIADWRSVDPLKEHLVFTVNGECKVDVVNGNPAGDPFRLLVWLANVGAKPFGGLHAGDTVTTGSWTGALFVEKGTSVSASFSSLGRIDLSLD